MTLQTFEFIRGTISRVFYTGDGGYGAFQLRTDKATISVCGTYPGKPKAGVEVEGAWTNHAKYGRQFKAASIAEIQPDDVDGLRVYIGSGTFPGVGPKLAHRLVDAFGQEVFEILEKKPERFRRIEDSATKIMRVRGESFQGRVNGYARRANCYAPPV